MQLRKLQNLQFFAMVLLKIQNLRKLRIFAIFIAAFNPRHKWRPTSVQKVIGSTTVGGTRNYFSE